MKQINYLNLSNKIKTNNGLVGALKALDKAITYITAILYGLLLLSLFLGALKGQNGASALLIKSIFVPALGFLVLSFIRKLINAPRPYEVYGFSPVLDKDTKGKSFPSRHVFSIFMIAVTFLQFSTVAFIVFCVMGLALGTIRILGGVHFLRDVIAGALIALTAGLICFFLIL